MTAEISFSNCDPIRTRCFCCPFSLLRRLLTCWSRQCYIKTFKTGLKVAWERVYYTTWHKFVYEQCNNSINGGHVFLVNNYSDGTKLSKSGSQVLTFIRVRFSYVNLAGRPDVMRLTPIRNYAEKCALRSAQ